jgi:hypothetical protein
MGKAYVRQSKLEQILEDCQKSLDFFIDSEIRDSILFVRYEDIARAPKNLTRQIYDHFQLEMNEEFIEKFDHATHANSDKEKSTFSVNKEKTEKEIFDGWKNSVSELVSEEEILEIEDKCRVMMKLFGYRADILGQNNVSAVEPDWSPIIAY